MVSVSEQVENPFSYASYRYDTETGLYYLQNRYYSPDLMRFITRDAIRDLTSDPYLSNYYHYAAGNPIMKIDPDGDCYSYAQTIRILPWASYFITGVGVIIGWKLIAVVGIAVIIYYGFRYAGQVFAKEKNRARDRIKGLQRQIDLHREKIRKEPNSNARGHWQKEINNSHNEILRLKNRFNL